MSRRTSEANRAIAAAWQNEQTLVSGGKGTRNWTQEQQRDILEKGKAYDDNGKAFEGQHMKSVEKYPEYQGDPENIQFLTKKEHLDAHQGSWQNPTNWYYDPVTKQFFDFGEGKYIPCKVMELSQPIAEVVGVNEEADCAVESAVSVYSEPQVKESTPRQFEHSDSTGKSHQPLLKKNAVKPNGVKHFFTGIGKAAKQLWSDHKGEIVGGVITFLVTTIPAIIDAATSSGNGSNGTSRSDGVMSDASTDDRSSYSVGDDSYSSPPLDSRERSSPREHEVPGHSQRYHTKNGVEWRDKAPYPRGGKDKEE